MKERRKKGGSFSIRTIPHDKFIRSIDIVPMDRDSAWRRKRRTTSNEGVKLIIYRGVKKVTRS